jgi:hypothetical protein
MAPEARLGRFREEFAAEMQGLPAGVSRVVLSAEQCPGLLDTPALIEGLRRFIAPFFGTIGIVVYLRRQDSHFVSNFTQRLRRGNVEPFRFPAEGEPHEKVYDYDRLLDDWAGVFGADRLTVRVHEPSSLLNGDAVDDFLQVLGLDLPIAADDRDRRANRAFPAVAVVLIRAMAARFAAEGPRDWAVSPAWRRFVARVEQLVSGEPWQPPASEARAFLSRFAATNEAVRRRWLPDRPALFAEAPQDAGAGGTGQVDGHAVVAALLTVLKAEVSRG